MILEMARLRDDVVQLDPITDSRPQMQYLFSLMPKYKYDTGDHLSKVKVVLKYGRHFWVGRTESFVGQVRAGVIYLCYFPEYDLWSLDAYRDDELLRALNRKVNYSHRAGKLVMDWFFRTYKRDLYTVHDIRSRAATIACKRLGFEVKTTRETPIGEFLIMCKKYQGDSYGQ